MYTNSPLQKKLWGKTDNAADAAVPSAHFTSLRTSEKARAAAHTSPAQNTTPRPRSPLPPVWSSSPSFELADGATPPCRLTTIMDPLAALRQCLQYVCSHPEIYGSDVRGLLDREVMHVVRLKASELSLIQGQRPLLVDPLDSTSIRQSARTFTSPRALPSISAAGNMPPAPPLPASLSSHAANTYDGCVPVGDLFGYGSVSFLPATSVGFSALLRDTRANMMNSKWKTMYSREDTNSRVPLPQLTRTQPLDELVQWNVTLPPHSSSRAATAGDNSNNAATAAAAPVDAPGPTSTEAADEAAGQKNRELQNVVALSSLDCLSDDPYAGLQHPEDARLFRHVDESSQNFNLPPSRGGVMCGDDGNPIVVDHHGYEVTYLRTQLQQLEAAFNAKCVRLHELESENKLFAEQMKASEESAARWSAEHHAMEGKLESLQRELDGWKDRANDAYDAATKQSKQRSQHAKQLASNQINDAKQEAARISQLWRETERALQESRRAFENTEKEANAAHNHLADAFHYLERLERRVARRDAYVQLCERRQRSLEEKYEKLMWCYEELSTIEGRYSYADYLLTTRPLWSVYLFLSLALHRGDFVVMEDQRELKRQMALMDAPFEESVEAASVTGDAAANVVREQAWMLFSRTPRGGCYAGAYFDPTLILRLIVGEVTAEVIRRGRAKQLRTNLHGSVACRVLRWSERFSIDYLGGQDSFPDSGELNRKFVPVLTMASVLLPLRSRSGLFMLAERATSAAAAAANNVSEPPPKDATTLGAAIPNVRRYDETTVRFVLRCFWKERLNAFVRQMEKRVAIIKAKQQRHAKLAVQHDRDCHSASATNLADNNDDSPSFYTANAARKRGDRKEVNQTAAVEEDDMDDVDVEVMESEAAIPTFLTALVDFSTRFTALAATAGRAPGGVPPGVADVGSAAMAAVAAASAASPTEDTATLLRVRGVLARGNSAKAGGGFNRFAGGTMSSFPSSPPPLDTTLWNCGRVFFAAVLLHNSTASPLNAVTTATNTFASTVDASKTNLSDGGSETEVEALADDVRELLAAMYYYAMEYKSLDPDFRLFYLVSHQLIPEMVAINFFASLESFQRDGAALLEKRIRYLTGESEDCGERVRTAEAAGAPSLADDPLTSLTRAVQIIDDAPLDGQDAEIDPDSDGEGYGSILPFLPKANVQNSQNNAASGIPPALSLQSRSENGVDSEQRIDSADSTRGAARRRAKERELLHNIRAYLKDRRPSLQLKDSDHHSSSSLHTGAGLLGDARDGLDGAVLPLGSPGGSPTAANFSVFAFGGIAGEWTALEEAVMQSLAPHTALLDTFRTRCGAKMVDLAANSFSSTASRSATPNMKNDRDYLRAKCDGRKMRHEVTKCLSATRGLLTLDDVLALLQRHCFSTYAVSCCGTPRFSLTDALMKGNGPNGWRAGEVWVGGNTPLTSTTMTQLQPFSVVGYLPPTGLHLQRLKFALSLDQSSHLVDATKLFVVDPVTKANSHLYNTYLTLTLDLFQQQQSFLMQSVLTSCTARHEKYAAEGAEDCDGQVPIAALRKGMTSALTAVKGSAQHAKALVNHFVQYDELLRLEDEVKLEQFADAPLLLNIPAESTRVLSAKGVGGFHHNSYHAARHNSSYGSTNDMTMSSTGRKSEAASIIDEVEDAEFNLREEAESCSLLHIAFAVRMTYIVWGRMCSDTAAAVVRRVVQRAVPTCRSQVDDAQWNGTAIKTTELPEWENFDRQVHQQYDLTLARLRNGHNADDNPIRHTLRAEYMKSLGISFPVPYSGNEDAAGRTLGKTASAASPATSVSAGSDDSPKRDAPPPYPDMAHVFSPESATIRKSSRTEGEGATSTTNTEKSKKRDASNATASRAVTNSSKRPSALFASPAPQETQQSVTVPDFGLISLSRALGFASPVVMSTASVGNTAGGAFALAKKATSKKASKKLSSKKVAGAESGAVSTAVQEEYARALSKQLQTFATRIAQLVKLNSPENNGNTMEGKEVQDLPPLVQDNGKQEAAITTLDRIVSLPNTDTDMVPTSPLPGRANARTRSVAFVQNTHTGQDGDDARHSTVQSSNETFGAPKSHGARSLAWRPVFAGEARGAEGNADCANPPNVALDVSKLYAACAALSTV